MVDKKKEAQDFSSSRTQGQTRKRRIEWLRKADEQNKRSDFRIKETGEPAVGFRAIVDVKVARWTNAEGIAELDNLLKNCPDAASIAAPCAPEMFFKEGDVAGGLLAAGACLRNGGGALAKAWMTARGRLSELHPRASDGHGAMGRTADNHSILSEALRAVCETCLALPLSSAAREALSEEARVMQACQERDENDDSWAERYGLFEPSAELSWLINNYDDLKPSLARFQAQLVAADLAEVGHGPADAAKKNAPRMRL